MAEAQSDIWWSEFNGAFWLTISASTFAFLGLALRACLKSRCTQISCCSSRGLVACDREPIADEFTNLGEVKVERRSEESMRRSETLADLAGNNVAVD